MVSARVSIERLQALLTREIHLPDSSAPAVDMSRPSIEIKSLSFDWGTVGDDDPVFLSAKERKQLKKLNKTKKNTKTDQAKDKRKKKDRNDMSQSLLQGNYPNNPN